MVDLYLPLDINYFHDEPFLAAGAYAELLYVRGSCWIKANTSDGRIGRAQLALFSIGIPSPAKHAKALVDVGLWRETETGWVVPAYLKRNRSRAQIQASREIAGEAGLKGAHERWHTPPNGTPNPKCSICIAERMGSPQRAPNGVAWPKTETQPESRPETETTMKPSSSVLTVVPDPPAADDDDDFERVVSLMVEAKVKDRRPERPHAYRQTTRCNTIAEDGELIRRMLADGDPPDQIALFVLGHGIGSTTERATSTIPWCTPECADCDGDGFTRTPEGLAPCPQRT